MNFSIGILVIVQLAAVSIRDCYCKVKVLRNDNYFFKYNVEQPQHNVVTQHWEERKGDLVRGDYSLLQPDNKIRLVEYVVDGEKGFRAAVKYRKPPGNSLKGHLHFPTEYSQPLWLMEPVGFITPDLLYGKRSYPNLPT